MVDADKNGVTASDALLLSSKIVCVFPQTDGEYDPVKASATELQYYGIPPKPDPIREHERFTFWLRMFSGAWTFLDPRHGDVHILSVEPATNPRPPVSPGLRHEGSLNWSGGYITPKDGRVFTQVHGQWHVPNPVRSDELPDVGPCEPEYRSSTWIGLDGQRRYFDSSLPQIGTAQNVEAHDGGRSHLYAWWQWWVRKQESKPQALPLCIKANDLVMCSLVVKDPHRVTFYIRNLTTRQACNNFTAEAPSVKPHGQPKVSGATAEWIMERPTCEKDRHTLYVLPNYGECEFSCCHAVSAYSGGEERTESLLDAKLVDMHTVKTHPHRTKKISLAKRTGDYCVTTTYR